jgi:hypothetical protein
MELLRQHRRIAMSSLFRRATKQPNSELLEFVLSPREAQPPILISPHYVQQSVRLFDFAHEHLADCAAALLEKAKSKSFKDLCAVTIPSFFGYFSSAEHINLAMKFYVSILSKTDSDLGSQILVPFFTAPGLSPFLDSSLNPFIQGFLKDHRPFSDAVVECHFKVLKKLFDENARVIPYTHRVLLRLMRTQWGVKGCANFFRECVLRPTIISWVQFRCHLEVRKVIDRILDRWSDVELTNTFCQVESIFEIPFQYSVFEDPFLLFLVSPGNVTRLVKLLERTGTLQPTFRSLLEDRPPSNIVFWLRTYPRHQLRPFDDYRRFIFKRVSISVKKDEVFERRWRAIEKVSEDCGLDPVELLRKNAAGDEAFMEYGLQAAILRLMEGADAFETYLLYRHHSLVTQRWMEICDAYERFMLGPLMTELSETSRTDQFLSTFLNASALIRSRANRQFLFLTILASFVPVTFRPSAVEFQTLGSEWTALLTSTAARIEAFRLNETNAAAAIFWEAVECIRTIDDEELPFQFMSLMQTMRLLHQMLRIGEAVDPWARLVIVFASELRKLISLFFIINVWAMGFENFRELCTEEEHRLWIAFQKVMLELIMESDTVSPVFFSLQRAFMAVV